VAKPKKKEEKKAAGERGSGRPRGRWVVGQKPYQCA